MPDVGSDSQANGFLVKRFRGRRPADPAAVLETRVFGDLLLGPRRTAWIERANTLRKTLHVLAIEVSSALRLTLAPSLADILVRKALFLRLAQGGFLDKKTLSFIPLAGSTPLQDDGTERRVLARTPREGCVAGREKDQMIEVSAREAKSTFLIH
jgi:hypothetical protein